MYRDRVDQREYLDNNASTIVKYSDWVVITEFDRVIFICVHNKMYNYKMVEGTIETNGD